MGRFPCVRTGDQPETSIASFRSRAARLRPNNSRKLLLGRTALRKCEWGSGYRRTDAYIRKGYLDMFCTPVFAFGHRLSYTAFDYGPLKLERDTVDVGGEFHCR